jgi:hypothetical protein
MASLSPSFLEAVSGRRTEIDGGPDFGYAQGNAE